MPLLKQAPTVSKTTIEQILSEGPITLKEARTIFPQRPDLSTLHRWRSRGAGKGNGAKLEAIRSGGVWYTSRAACIRFIQARSK